MNDEWDKLSSDKMDKLFELICSRTMAGWQSTAIQGGLYCADGNTLPF